MNLIIYSQKDECTLVKFFISKQIFQLLNYRTKQTINTEATVTGSQSYDLNFLQLYGLLHISWLEMVKGNYRVIHIRQGTSVPIKNCLWMLPGQSRMVVVPKTHMLVQSM